ncbi:MAG: extracellular solute-binding protein [Gemmatimonadaceae bacterium]
MNRTILLFAATVALILPVSSFSQATAPRTLVVAAIGGSTGATIRSLYEPWEKRENVKIQWVTNANSISTVAKIVAQKAHPEFDIAFGDNITHYSGLEHGIWGHIDPKIVTNLKDTNTRAIPADGGGVGFGFFYAGLFYRYDEFQKLNLPPPTSWFDIFRKDLCGRVGLQVATSTYTVQMLIMLAGGKADKVPQAIKDIAAHKDCFPVLEAVNNLEQKVQSGEYLLGVHGQIRVLPLVKKGLPVRFVLPKEGSVISYSTVSIVNNAPHPELAQSFINWILEPSVQEELAKRQFYGPVNTTVKVPAELVAQGVPDAAMMAGMTSVSEKVIFDNRRDWSQQLERAMAR